MIENYTPQTPDTYVSPLPAGEKFFFVSARKIFPYYADAPYGTSYYQKVELNGNMIWDNEYVSLPNSFIGRNIGFETILSSGVYKITYELYTYANGERQDKLRAVSYTFQVVENRYPAKKESVLDVIHRVLELAEPRCVVKNGNSVEYVKPPRFHFAYKFPENTPDGISERKLFAQTAPEFTFTQMTLRECLQEIGKFIHAEPRLRNKNEIIFDRYGEQDRAEYRPCYLKKGEKWEPNTEGLKFPFTMHPYKGKRFTDDVGVACTYIESEVDNFVNRLDRTGGTIAEPYRGGAITLRTDTAYTRLEDTEGMYFPTTMPIMDVTSLKWVDLEGIAGDAGRRYDITAYVFEKTIYDAELSSYEAQYPKSKCFGLYFTQGSNGIRGFFFKNEEWSGGVFAQYAITNILSQVTGQKLDKMQSLVTLYPRLCFELVYTPIYGTRLSHGKSYTGDMLKKPFGLLYNQSANVVETRYYGEHLKGVAERLGNRESTVSILLRNVGNLPKIGQMWDDDYYISTVTCSAVLDGILVDIGLTKKFNRLSEYVGANSYKRYYEVSERMAQRRRTLYKDYLLITDSETPPEKGKDCFMQYTFLLAVANTFFQASTMISGGMLTGEVASMVSVQGFSKKFNPQNEVLLPVISSAFGNTMEFSWSFKDNYSAGISSTYQESKDESGESVSGYFGAEVTYGDLYGKAYYQKYTVKSRYISIDIDEALSLPNDFDGNAINLIGQDSNVYRVLRKDSREILDQSYAVEFVTDIKNLIIGSALARNNPLIGGLSEKASAVLYVLPGRVNRFSNGDIDLTGATEILSYKTDDVIMEGQVSLSGYVLNFAGHAATVNGKAWAIVTKKYEGETTLEEDEDGNVVPVTPVYGGELLLAWNGDIAVGDTVGAFKIAPLHDIFDVIK